MARILLSHAVPDRPQARRLAEGLRRAGHQPWLIEDEVRVGRSVLDVLHDGLRDSDFVVACVSKDAMRSGWQEAELRFILDKLTPGQTPGLIPVRLDDAELPENIQDRAGVDIQDTSWDRGLAELTERLQELETLALGRDQIRQKDIGFDAVLFSCSPEARRLMQAATVFAPSPIYNQWLIDIAGLETTDARNALVELVDKGLVEFDATGQQVAPHQTALDKLRVQLEPDLLVTFQVSVLRTLAAWVFAIEDPSASTAVVTFSNGYPHVEKALQTTPPAVHPHFWSTLSTTWGVCVCRRGDLSSGRKWLEQAFTVSERDPELAVIALLSLQSLARIWKTMGEYSHARSNVEHAVAIAQTLPEKDRRDSLPELLVELVFIIQDRDAFAAKRIAQQALEIEEAKPDATAAARGWYLFVVALCTRDVDGAEVALPLCERALKLVESEGTQGDVARTTLMLAGLSRILLQLNELDGASAALERALTIERGGTCANKHSIALRLSDLALVRLEQERLEETKGLFEQARDQLEYLYGPEAKDLGVTIHNLGRTLLKLGDRAGARNCFNRSLPLLERMQGPDHPYVASNRANLFLTMEPGSDEFKREMDRLFSTGLTLYTPKSGPGAMPLQRALVLARSQQAPPAEVSHALSEALRVAEEGGSSENAARAGLLLGAVLGSSGAWESAQQHLERALRASKQTEDDMLVAEAYRLLGDATLHGSHYEDARLNYVEAIRRYEAVGLLRKAAKTRLILLTMLLQLGHGQEASALSPLLHKALADGLFTDDQERANVELALRLADSQSRGGTP